MYIQITERCNMSCAHCCMRAAPEGEDMSLETFRAALAYDDYSATLGGGEPTLHPLFWAFLVEAIAECEEVWLATNGSVTETALKLAKLARKGVIAVALSQDDFHDPIDPRVVQAFTDKMEPHGYSKIEGDHREIRNVSDNIIRVGRAEDNDFGAREDCACEDFFVKPNGDILQCGCPGSPKVGDVFRGFDDDAPMDPGCYKEVFAEL